MVTKEEFMSYENVRRSGVTNMFNVNYVVQLSGLSKEMCLDIMKNYGQYADVYLNGNKR